MQILSRWVIFGVTMARRSQPQLPASRRGVVSFRWKLITALSAALCTLALLSIHYRQSRPVPSLSVARSRIPLQKYSGDRPKIAFLFLARLDLPLDFLWDRFFKVWWSSIPLWIGKPLMVSCCDFLQGGDERNLSIYVHSIPGFVFDEGTTRSHFFHNRQLKNSIEVSILMHPNYREDFDWWTETLELLHLQVVWGEASMIAAERLLLASALEDSSNQRFVLLSDRSVASKIDCLLVFYIFNLLDNVYSLWCSCVPLYDFGYIYSYLMSSPKSFVDR